MSNYKFTGKNIACQYQLEREDYKNLAKIHVIELVFITAFFFLLFEDSLSQLWHNAKYLDEAFAAFGLILYLKTNDKPSLGIALPVLLFVAVGILGALMYPSQPFVAVFFDIFLCLKFFFSILFGLAVAKILTNQSLRILCAIAKALTLIIFFLIICNFLFDIFPSQEYRFGIQVSKLFFSHSEHLAGLQVVLMALIIGNAPSEDKVSTVCVALSIFNIAFTLRYKALIAALFAIVLLYIVMIKKQRFLKRYLVLFALMALVIAWEQVNVYFGDNVTARSALSATSISIAMDHFPIGVGFSAFGSYMSRVYYSPIYSDYLIDNVYGLMNTEGGNLFISDTFWPMILGQGGFLGLFFFVWGLFAVYKKIEMKYETDVLAYATALYLLVYMLIQSTSSAAFVSPIAVPVGIVIGICLGYKPKNFCRKNNVT